MFDLFQMGSVLISLLLCLLAADPWLFRKYRRMDWPMPYARALPMIALLLLAISPLFLSFIRTGHPFREVIERTPQLIQADPAMAFTAYAEPPPAGAGLQLLPWLRDNAFLISPG